ncbi:DUF6203 family protein [Nonomuraea maritima]|uniref:DUF6203 family protein n=1 Tax=Nonomuraea maritima TaxID=683260 RepID=UPI00371792C4
MLNFLRLLLARRLTRTPIGLIVMGVIWLLARRRRQRQEQTRPHPGTAPARQRHPAARR